MITAGWILFFIGAVLWLINKTIGMNWKLEGAYCDDSVCCGSACRVELLHEKPHAITRDTSGSGSGRIIRNTFKTGQSYGRSTRHN